jgi:hypothetical protein
VLKSTVDARAHEFTIKLLLFFSFCSCALVCATLPFCRPSTPTFHILVQHYLLGSSPSTRIMSEGIQIDQLLGGLKLDNSLGAVFIGTVIAGA